MSGLNREKGLEKSDEGALNPEQRSKLRQLKVDVQKLDEKYIRVSNEIYSETFRKNQTLQNSNSNCITVRNILNSMWLFMNLCEKYYIDDQTISMLLLQTGSQIQN